MTLTRLNDKNPTKIINFLVFSIRYHNILWIPAFAGIAIGITDNPSIKIEVIYDLSHDCLVAFE